MPKEMPGRRIAYAGGDPTSGLTQAGDYCGPVDGYIAAGTKSVWYLLPVARDVETAPGGRSVHFLASPPHVIYEEPDGSLTVRNSIGAEPHWHGFLNAGHWELAPRETPATSGKH
jgi:hypothetical protein